MIEIIIKEEALEQIIQKLQSFVWTDQNKQEIELMRQDFAQTYDKAKLNSLTKEDYFIGLGRQKGCISYDLEWGTLSLGSIKGGSKYKYGYDTDFSKIKSLCSAFSFNLLLTIAYTNSINASLTDLSELRIISSNISFI